jgi:hypothetical protein
VTPRKPELVERIHIAVSKAEKRLFKRLAAESFEPFSQWVRRACREAASKQSREKDRERDA